MQAFFLIAGSFAHRLYHQQGRRGFLGYLLAYFSAPSPLIRYLADGAYWGYLVHLPVVIFFQILVAPYPWPWPVKLLLILGPTFLILGLSYQVGVRHTRLGQLSRGRWSGRRLRRILAAMLN